MSKIKRLVVVLALTLTACSGGDPVKPEVVAQGRDYSVQFLFEIDGCRVYSFVDGKTVHFVKCGSTATAQESYSCGKSCVYDAQVVTSNKE